MDAKTLDSTFEINNSQSKIDSKIDSQYNKIGHDKESEREKIKEISKEIVKDTIKDLNLTKNSSKDSTSLSEAKLTISQLKDELSRKNRILQSMKQAKASYANSLEQWKSESQKSADTIKR